MKLEVVRARHAPGLGRVELRPGEGVVGWVGGTVRDRRALLDLLLGSLGLADPPDPGPGERGGAPSSSTRAVVRLDGRRIELRDGGVSGSGGAAAPSAALGLSPRELALVWAGPLPGASPRELLDEATRLLARLRGLDRLEAALARLDSGGDPPAGEAPEPLAAELEEVESELEALSGVPDRLERLEADLRELRAEAAEADGDLDAAHEDWLRERQDAETHLQACRDRARELRSGLRRMEEGGREADCPFCGRPLGDRHEGVLDELREEWERLVQDGRWWRRRREQLEEKPDHVRELEARSLRLRSEIEERAERLERWRFALRRRDELRERRRELREALGGVPRDRPGEPDGNGRLVRERRARLRDALASARDELVEEEAEALVRRSGACLNRISGGRVLGITRSPDGRPLPIEDGRPVPNPGEEDRIALTVALRLALGLRVVGAGVPLRSLLLGGPFRTLDFETRLRTVELLRSVRSRIPQLLLVAGDEVVEAAPERFDRIFEFTDERRGGRPALRAIPGGVGVLLIE